MELDRARIVDQNFSQRVFAQEFPRAHSNTTPLTAGLDKDNFLRLFASQMVSRQLDILARNLKETGQGYYTIGSSGHEGNAAIAKAFRINDMAFLHYRSGAFMQERARFAPQIDMLYDQVLSLVAASEDPISGGRHKVFGSVPLFVPPQTSTIASHLPKALGTALSIALVPSYKKAEFSKLPKDSVVLCSFGDASLNHSTAQGALNATQWIVQAKMPLPIVWICEDNGLGISVPTPSNWVADTVQQRQGIHYLACDGRNLADVYKVAKQAEQIARHQRQPVFLHMQTVRLLGHAGSDIEFHYHSEAQITALENDDPLLHSAKTVLAQGWLSAQQIVEQYEAIRANVNVIAQRAIARPKLLSKQAIMASIIPPTVNRPSPPKVAESQRKQLLAKQYAQSLQPRTLAQCINLALTDLMVQYPNIVIFGEDVGKKGGVYRVTADLQARFGASRVFDTLLDEQTILGTAIGLAHNGFIPIPEIQFLAYTHNAADQIRGEAATLSYFSNGQYTNPMVIRIPALAYQQGLGGHFHNDNAIGFLREIPGVVIACPSNGRDAALLLRCCVDLAYRQQRVVIFLEPIALYMTKEQQPGDGMALSEYPDAAQTLTFGSLGIEQDSHSETVIISYGNGMHLSRKAATILKNEHQQSVQLIDLRWLAPLNTAALMLAVKDKKNIIIVDECRRTGSLSESLVSIMLEQLAPLPKIRLITAEDCFIPLGKAWEYILPSCEMIVTAVLAMNRPESKECM